MRFPKLTVPAVRAALRAHSLSELQSGRVALGPLPVRRVGRFVEIDEPSQSERRYLRLNVLVPAFGVRAVKAGFRFTPRNFSRFW